MTRHSSIYHIFKVSALYVGTVIGAGFASGQEIMQFFILYGCYGLAGITLATVIFSYLGLVIMGLATARRTDNYADLLPYLMGKGMASLLDLISLFMLLGGLAVMLAGSGAVLNENLGWPQSVGTLVAALITGIVVLGGLQGVLLVNMLLVPLKLFLIALVCILTLQVHGIHCPGTELPAAPRVAVNWLWAALLYVSYNMVVPVAVLSSLGYCVPRRAGMLGGLAGGLLLGLTAALITLTGLLFYPGITASQVPLLYIAARLGDGWRHILGALIWLAVVTTAIANTHGFASRLTPRGGWTYRVMGLGTIMFALPLAQLNFSRLVQILYPLFGYAGLTLMFTLLLAPVLQLCRKH